MQVIISRFTGSISSYGSYFAHFCFPFSVGDAQPDVNAEKFTLYAMRFCPFCQRVLFTLAYHGLDYDIVPINLTSKPKWYLGMQPDGKVPLLRYKGDKLSDSVFIMRFVDQFKGPDASLLNVCGEDFFTKAMHIYDMLMKPFYKIMFTKTATSSEIADWRTACTELDSSIQGPFLAGEKLSLADILLYPLLNVWDAIVARVAEVETAPGGDASSALGAWPKIAGYRNKMAMQSQFDAVRLPSDTFIKYAATRREEKADYDI